MVEGAVRCGRRDAVLPSPAVSSAQRRDPVEEALGTERLPLHPHILLAQEYASEVQTPREEAEEGMKGRSQRSVQEC
jgi:hypothetical protein